LLGWLRWSSTVSLPVRSRNCPGDLRDELLQVYSIEFLQGSLQRRRSIPDPATGRTLSVFDRRCNILQGQGKSSDCLQGIYDCLWHKQLGCPQNPGLRHLSRRIHHNMDGLLGRSEEAGTLWSTDDHFRCSWRHQGCIATAISRDSMATLQFHFSKNIVELAPKK